MRCWIAPRDVAAGKVWDEAILDAIEGASAFLLILSSSANGSHFVKNEVNRAFSLGKPIVTFRVEDVTPGRSLDLYLARHHWTDGFPPPLEPRVAQLAAAVSGLLGVGILAGASGTAVATGAPAAPPRVKKRTGAAPAWLRRALTATLGALVVAALTAAGTLSWRTAPAGPAVARFELTLPQDQAPSTTARRIVAVSPDGTQIVYAADRRLYLRSIGDLTPRPISGTDIVGAGGGLSGLTDPVFSPLTDPVFSPDGQWIAFFIVSRAAIGKIPAAGGAPVAIADGGGMGLHWSGDAILFGQAGAGIMRVSANGGTPELVVRVDEGQVAYGPQMLPDGETVLFTLAEGIGWDNAQIVAQSLRSGDRTVLIKGGSDARYLETGHIVYAVRGVLFGVLFDAQSLAVTGGAFPLVEGVGRAPTATTGVAQFAVSPTGTLIYLPGPVSSLTAQIAIGRFDRNGSAAPLKVPTGLYLSPRVSPDGTRLAFGSDDGKEAAIWVHDLAGTSATRRLTFGGGNRFPVWSPKGDTLLFNVTKGSTVSLWTLSLQDRKAAPFPGVESSIPTTAMLSPDGRWIAYSTRQGAQGALSVVYVQPFPATGAVYQISGSSEDGHHPVWSADGRELFYIPGPGTQLASVRITTSPAFVSSTVAPVVMRFQNDAPTAPARNYDVSRDGTFIGLMPGGVPTGDRAAMQFVVVLNWFEELKRLVPVN